MKQNKRFKQDFIINKDYATNQNLSQSCDKLEETNSQDFVSKKTNRLKFARGKSESTFEFRTPQAKNSYGNFKQKNRTHKFTKIFAGVSLATLITCGTVLGFAPLASTNNTINPTIANSSAISQTLTGLITPHEDDPIVYTTESGINIKYSLNSITTSPGFGTNSGLGGYCYFTTNDGTNDYVWVIIGKSPDVSTNYRVDYNIANWISTSEYRGSLRDEFLNNQYETASPAGELVSTIFSENEHVIGDDILSNDEIPSGCVLCLANGSVASGAFTTDGLKTASVPKINYTIAHTDYYYDSTYTHALAVAMSGYYTNGSFGLNSVKSAIQGVSITTTGYVSSSATSSGCGGLNSASRTDVLYCFPLGGNENEQFYYYDYLTQTHAKTTFNWTLRTNAGTSVYWDSVQHYVIPQVHYINTAGELTKTSVTTSLSHRPAFCLKVV